MELYYIISALVVLTAIFSYINARIIKMPSTVGIMMIAMVVSVSMVAFGSFFPKTVSNLTHIVGSIDFHELLMGVMLNFLLFAGAMHIKISDLKEERGAIFMLSTFSVVISTFVVGTLLFSVLLLTNIAVDYIECLIFGALISPTDPIAVLGVLKNAKVSRSLEIKVAGESLFNDGIAIVLFITLVGIALNNGEVEVSAFEMGLHLAQEIIGGLLLGLVLGVTTSQFMKHINNYNVDVMITLSVVMGGSLLATNFGFSSPLAMVASGLIIGNYGRKRAMSALTREYLDKFWELIDEMLNAILFLIMGLQLLVIPFQDIQQFWMVGIVAVVLVLLARLVSIWLPAKLIPFKKKLSKKTIAMLVWGGLRGGVSVAMALSLDASLNRNLFVVITFLVVVFSIFIQGMTISKMAKRMEA